MAAMNDSDRAVVAADYNQQISLDRVPCGINKNDIRAAVNAADQWVSDNAASFNNALPAAAKNNLTAAEKSRILKLVLTRRYQVGA